VRFKLDENLPRAARVRFENEQWDVDDVHDEGLASAIDEEIQRACEAERRVLVTLDLDFADTRRYDPSRSPGVIVLRPTDQSVDAIVQCVDGAIRALRSRPIAASLWIVEPERLRIRDYPRPS
jgi:predicted nuclease of predicted toxin-antitoxin system